MKVPYAMELIKEAENLLKNLEKLDELNRSQDKPMEKMMADADCNTTWVNLSANLKLIIHKHNNHLQKQINEAEIEGID